MTAKRTGEQKISALGSLKNFVLSDKNYYDVPIYVRLAICILMIVIVTWLKFVLYEYIGYRTPFLLYFSVVIICTRYLGIGTAIFATIVCALVTSYFFYQPNDPYKFPHYGSIQLIIFTIECLFIAGLGRLSVNANKKLKQNEKRFQALIENNADGLAMLNTEGKIIYVSPAVEKILGFTTEEFLQVNPATLINLEEMEMLTEKSTEMRMRPGHSVTFIHQYKNKNNNWLWIETTLTNMLHQPDINAIVANFRNVTDKVLLQQEKDDFIGVASHELKNPLTSLKLHLDLLDISQETEAKETRKLYTAKALVQVKRIIVLMNELLDVSKIESGRLQVSYEYFYIEELVYESIDTHLAGTSNSNIKVNGNLNIKISGDKHRLEQVLLNFLSNASKYSPENSLIIINVTQQNNQIKIAVTDNGVGVPKNKMSMLFKKFVRIPNSKMASGFGLGLYISSQIIQAHKGQIGAESEEGEGSTFWFTIPLRTKK